VHREQQYYSHSFQSEGKKMTVFRKQNYEDQDDGRTLKAARKQQYIMFPAPISFPNDELKAELGMKTKKEEEETNDAKFCLLKVPMDHEDKDSKIYVVKVKKYDSGTPEEFLKWRLILNEQTKNNGYAGKYDDHELGASNVGGRQFGSVFDRDAHKKQKTEYARPMARRYIPPRKIMIMKFMDWQFVLLTSKVDGEMPMRCRENI
jgi:hypothetical protein